MGRNGKNAGYTRMKKGDLFKPKFKLELNQEKLKTQTKEWTGILSRSRSVSELCSSPSDEERKFLVMDKRF